MSLLIANNTEQQLSHPDFEDPSQWHDFDIGTERWDNFFTNSTPVNRTDDFFQTTKESKTPINRPCSPDFFSETTNNTLGECDVVFHNTNQMLAPPPPLTLAPPLPPLALAPPLSPLQPPSNNNNGTEKRDTLFHNVKQTTLPFNSASPPVRKKKGRPRKNSHDTKKSAYVKKDIPRWKNAEERKRKREQKKLENRRKMEEKKLAKLRNKKSRGRKSCSSNEFLVVIDSGEVDHLPTGSELDKLMACDGDNDHNPLWNEVMFPTTTTQDNGDHHPLWNDITFPTITTTTQDDEFSRNFDPFADIPLNESQQHIATENIIRHCGGTVNPFYLQKKNTGRVYPVSMSSPDITLPQSDFFPHSDCNNAITGKKRKSSVQKESLSNSVPMSVIPLTNTFDATSIDPKRRRLSLTFNENSEQIPTIHNDDFFYFDIGRVAPPFSHDSQQRHGGCGDDDHHHHHKQRSMSLQPEQLSSTAMTTQSASALETFMELPSLFPADLLSDSQLHDGDTEMASFGGDDYCCKPESKEETSPMNIDDSSLPPQKDDVISESNALLPSDSPFGGASTIQPLQTVTEPDPVVVVDDNELSSFKPTPETLMWIKEHIDTTNESALSIFMSELLKKSLSISKNLSFTDPRKHIEEFFDLTLRKAMENVPEDDKVTHKKWSQTINKSMTEELRRESSELKKWNPRVAQRHRESLGVGKNVRFVGMSGAPPRRLNSSVKFIESLMCIMTHANCPEEYNDEYYSKLFGSVSQEQSDDDDNDDEEGECKQREYSYSLIENRTKSDEPLVKDSSLLYAMFTFGNFTESYAKLFFSDKIVDTKIIHFSKTLRFFIDNMMKSLFPCCEDSSIEQTSSPALLSIWKTLYENIHSSRGNTNDKPVKWDKAFQNISLEDILSVFCVEDFVKMFVDDPIQIGGMTLEEHKLMGTEEINNNNINLLTGRSLLNNVDAARILPKDNPLAPKKHEVIFHQKYKNEKSLTPKRKEKMEKISRKIYDARKLESMAKLIQSHIDSVHKRASITSPLVSKTNDDVDMMSPCSPIVHKTVNIEATTEKRAKLFLNMKNVGLKKTLEEFSKIRK